MLFLCCTLNAHIYVWGISSLWACIFLPPHVFYYCCSAAVTLSSNTAQSVSQLVFHLPRVKLYHERTCEYHVKNIFLPRLFLTKALALHCTLHKATFPNHKLTCVKIFVSWQKKLLAINTAVFFSVCVYTFVLVYKPWLLATTTTINFNNIHKHILQKIRIEFHRFRLLLQTTIYSTSQEDCFLLVSCFDSSSRHV